MIEPTESENIAEMDRFISAMLTIREEINEIASGMVPLEQSALRNAPHTAQSVVESEWKLPYERRVGAFPAGVESGLARAGKYWPTVGRIDGAFGDRNLVCSCEPIEALAIN